VTAPDHIDDELDRVSFGVLTVSTSRTLADDESGDAIVQAIEKNGHRVVARELVSDDREAIRAAVLALVETDTEVVVVTGGTGLAPDDVTVEAVAPLCDRAIPGFGELFRSLSYDDIGPNALLSRADAGVIDTVPVFCLPGSTQGATLGTKELILPTVTHVLAHTQRD
jgi:molybdenum cofactor biosynthesis protein B